MSIEVFQIASAAFGAMTVGLGYVSYGLHKHLKAANDHVANLKRYVVDQANREEGLIRQVNDLNAIVTKVHDQRRRALERATLSNKARAEARRVGQQAAAQNTLSALASTPLRPREEVVAGIRKPEQVSDAG